MLLAVAELNWRMAASRSGIVPQPRPFLVRTLFADGEVQLSVPLLQMAVFALCVLELLDSERFEMMAQISSWSTETNCKKGHGGIQRRVSPVAYSRRPVVKDINHEYALQQRNAFL